MSSRKVKRRKPKATGPGQSGAGARRSRAGPRKEVGAATQIESALLAKRERYFEFVVIAALLAFGVYQSVVYFGHTVVPISDFPDIVRVGHDLLSFQLPARFKQAPVVGLLQASLSYLVGGQHPDLTAGWLLNAILHPLNLVLFYLVGRQVIGKAAVWFALVAIINHWVMYMMTEPIMETTLLFFSLLTFYLIFRRSNWCYVAASVTTMVRYEGAALILAALVMDMIHYKSKRERIRALAYSALAMVPLATWMLATVLTWKAGTTHYLNVLFTKEYAKAFSGSAKDRRGLLIHMRLLWSVGFHPLLVVPSEIKASFTRLTSGEIEAIRTFFSISKIAALAGFLFGAIYGLFKRQWRILSLLIFFVPYFVLHAVYPYPLQRFHTNIFWIAVLIFLFGLSGFWRLIDNDGRIPGVIAIGLQALVVLIAVGWLISLLPQLSKISAISPKSVSLPYVAMALVGAICAVRIYVHGRRYALREFAILAVVCLVVVSNQFSLVRLLGDGQRDKEFKLLADWYITNADPGEKLGVYMRNVVGLFAPKYSENFVALPEAENPSEFTKACYSEDITYVVWASREGLSNDHTGYRRLGLHENIAHLRTPKSTGPYEFVEQVGSKRGYVNIFRLIRPADEAERISTPS